MDYSELQADVDELKKDAESIVDSLDCAETCETLGDFKANLAEASRDLKSLAKRVTKMYSESQKAV